MMWALQIGGRLALSDGSTAEIETGRFPVSMPAIKDVREVDLAGVQLLNDESVHMLGAFSSVTKLDLSATAITEVPDEAFRRLLNLTQLDLSDTRVRSGL